MSLAKLQTTRKVSEPFHGATLFDLIRCDPRISRQGRSVSESSGKHNNLAIGGDELVEYCSSNQTKIIRSHECIQGGALLQQVGDYEILTVFEYDMDNSAAILVVDSRCKVKAAIWNNRTAYSNYEQNRNAFIEFMNGRTQRNWIHL
jgi:hypothetical protein